MVLTNQLIYFVRFFFQIMCASKKVRTLPAFNCARQCPGDETCINLFLEQKFNLHQNKAKVCSIKCRSKHSVVIVLCLQRNLTEQTIISIVISYNTCKIACYRTLQAHKYAEHTHIAC